MRYGLRGFYDAVCFFLYLYIMACGFSYKEGKRSRFWLKIIIGGAFGILLSYAISFWEYYEKLSYIPKYILALAATCICLIVAFKITPKKAIFYTICGVALEYLANSAFWLLFTCLTLLNCSPELDSWLFVLGEAGVTAVIYSLFCLLYVKRVQHKGYIEFYEETLLIPLLIVLVLIVTTQIMPQDLIAGDPIMASLIISAYDMSLSGIILYSMYKLYVISEMRTEAGIVRTLAVKQKEQYEAQKKNIDYINEKCHDIRKMIEVFKEGGLSDESTEELYGKINIYDCHADTGNEIIDTILSEKSLLCEKENITFTYIVDGKAVGFLDAVDMCAIFINMLDNAIEAALKIPEKKERIISLHVAADGNMLYINQYNSFAEEPRREGKNFVTSKDDKRAHGFGIKSMRSTVRKHGGELNITVDGNLFSVDVILPMPETFVPS